MSQVPLSSGDLFAMQTFHFHSIFSSKNCPAHLNKMQSMMLSNYVACQNLNTIMLTSPSSEMLAPQQQLFTYLQDLIRYQL